MQDTSDCECVVQKGILTHGIFVRVTYKKTTSHFLFGKILCTFQITQIPGNDTVNSAIYLSSIRFQPISVLLTCTSNSVIILSDTNFWVFISLKWNLKLTIVWPVFVFKDLMYINKLLLKMFAIYIHRALSKLISHKLSELSSEKSKNYQRKQTKRIKLCLS